MRRLFALTLLAFAAFTGNAFAGTAYPQKIAVIVMENEKASNIIGSANAPYINNFLDASGITLTGMKEGTATHTNPTGSAEEYSYQTSGDNCGGTSVDSYWNTGSNNPIASATCGKDVFKLLSDAGVSWKAYNEYFQVGTTTCTSAFSDASVHKQYARKHNPSLFYDDVVPSPYTSCPNTVGFPQNNTNIGVTTNFNGSDGFPQFSYIVPGLCHDMHDAATDCQPSGAGGTPDYFNGSGASSSPCGGSLITNKIAAADCWLQLNFNNIRRDVGRRGVVILTWDEGNDNTTRESIAGYVVPGLGTAPVGGFEEAGHLKSCFNGDCTDSTAYDQLSVLRSISKAFTGTSCYSGLNTSAASDCAAVSDLPITMVNEMQGVQASNASGTSTTVSATWPSATTAGNFLVASVVAKGTVSGVTPPSGWTLAKQSSSRNIGIYYCSNCASQSGAQTWTFGEGHRGTVSMWEIEGVASSSTVDSTGSATATSGSDATQTSAYSGLGGTTSQANELLFSAYFNNNGSFYEPPGTPTQCPVGGGTPTLAPWQELDQAGVGATEAEQLNWAAVTQTGQFCSFSTFDTATTWRGVLAAFTN